MLQPRLWHEFQMSWLKAELQQDSARRRVSGVVPSKNPFGSQILECKIRNGSHCFRRNPIAPKLRKQMDADFDNSFGRSMRS